MTHSAPIHINHLGFLLSYAAKATEKKSMAGGH